jgi:hypothetical protein
LSAITMIGDFGQRTPQFYLECIGNETTTIGENRQTKPVREVFLVDDAKRSLLVRGYNGKFASACPPGRCNLVQFSHSFITWVDDTPPLTTSYEINRDNGTLIVHGHTAIATDHNERLDMHLNCNRLPSEPAMQKNKIG